MRGGEEKERTGCRNPRSYLQARCRTYRPSFKREWVGVGGGTAHAQGTRAGQRDTSLESQRKVSRAAGMASGRVPPWQGGPRKFKTSLSFQTLDPLKRDLWVNREDTCMALRPVWLRSG